MPLKSFENSIEKSWKIILKKEFNKPYFKSLEFFLFNEKRDYTVYPSYDKIFSAFEYCAFDNVKVVVIGQDPYHGMNQAHGLSFSVNNGIKPPPSLKNIYKELANDIGFEIPNHGNLNKWAKQGVLLLNSILTVREKQPGSHRNKGWENFTDSCIKKISEKKDGVIFLLWGNYAIQKELIIDPDKHFVLKTTHPSPFSARKGFFGCKHFSKTNEILIMQEKKAIDWKL